jgi:hypothetical protein
MIYFRLNRPVQVALIGAALAAPGCYLSHGEDDQSDVRDGRDGRDARDDGDVFVVDDVPDSAEIPDARDTEPDDFVVDMAPPPNCDDTETATLTARGVEAATNYGVGEVVLNAPAIGPDELLSCWTYPCVEVVPDGGVGTVSDITPYADRTVRFRYSYPTMSYGEVVHFEIRWRIECRDPDAFRETTVVGSAWACRDDAFRIQITGSFGECPSVIDVAPMPMARNGSTSNTPSPDSLALRAVPVPGGAFRLRAFGPESTRSFRWVASGGKLRMVSDAEAIFQPDDDAGLYMVQVAAFTRTGVSIQVFRRRRG